MKRKFYWMITLFALCFIWACSSDNDGAETPTDDVVMTDDDIAITFDRGAMLANWADNIIVPSYNAFLDDFSGLTAAFDTFNNEPTEANLVALRMAWVETYKSWQSIDLFEIGPAEDNGLRLNVNTYPTDVDLIQDNIASGSYNFELSSNRDSRGFPALDYLLNGIADTDTAIVAVYADANTGSAYLNYISDILNDINSRITNVRDAWQNGYRDTFVENDGASATASVDRFVNDFIFYYEKFLRAGKMGIPLGVFSRTQAPNLVEAFYYPQLSNELFLDGLNTVDNFFNGMAFGTETNGESLASYLVALGRTDLNDAIQRQLESARVAVAGLEPFRTELETNNPAEAMFAAYDEVQRAVALFKVDMVSAMSIAIDFVDADGD